MGWFKSRRSQESNSGQQTLLFKSNEDAFKYACDNLQTSLENENPVLGMVLETKGNGEYFVKVANDEDSSIPVLSGNELLEHGNLEYICVCAKAIDVVPLLRKGDLVMCMSPSKLRALNKALGVNVLMVVILAKIKSELHLAHGWAVDK